MEEIMANNGFNYVRLRTFVNPSAPQGYSPGQEWCGTADTVKKAVRMKKCGMGVLVDFHMSDTWASLGSQKMPAAWVGLSQTVPATPVSAATHDDNIYQAAHDYVASVMQALVAAGAKPDMVQIGNETNPGMSGIEIDGAPAAFAALVNAGIKAVRETDPAILVWAQNGRPRPNTGNPVFTAWVDDYLSGTAPHTPAIDEDGICGSTYGTTNNGVDWTQSFQYVITTYDKPVMSCEYTDTSPNSPAGSLINNIMRGYANKKGFGSFIWEPADYPAINANGTLFTKTGNTYTTNATMKQYPTLAKSYGLPVPSGTCP
jgi:arabinogalactan endo-1,4-beta-galactosidase